MHPNHYPVWISNRKNWDRRLFDFFRINKISSSKWAAQTYTNVIISNSIATQTESIHENIGNVNSGFKHLPSLSLIKVNMVKNEIACLVDTDSSISLLSNSVFQNLKSKLSYKNLSSNITQKTVN